MSADATPVLRYDAATDDWVIFSPARGKRPHGSSAALAATQTTETCPFCPGNEQLTAEELLRTTDELSPGSWTVRVVANKFPALRRSLSPEPTELGPLFREMGGYGAHEVVIESPDHVAPLPLQPLEQVERVLSALHQRFATLSADPRLRAIVIFKNHGRRAGTSLAHPHWQIIATPILPRLLRHKHAVAREYFDRTARSLFCVMRDEELRDGTRVIDTNDDYVAVMPYASHVPFQVRILPRRHRSSFGSVTATELRSLALILKSVLLRLRTELGDPDYNLSVGTAALREELEPYFLWHIDILPRIARRAGFEVGSGMSINSVLPEDAAKILTAGAAGGASG